MSEINEPKNYIKSQFYPNNSKGIIKERRLLLNNDLYIITWDGIDWRVFFEGKQIAKNPNHSEVYKKIPKDN